MGPVLVTFSATAGSTNQTLTSNVPNRTRSTTGTSWVARSISRLGFGIGNTGSRLKVLYAVSALEEVGATTDLERCRDLLRIIEGWLEDLTTSHESDLNGELLGTVIPPARINLPFQVQGTKRYCR